MFGSEFCKISLGIIYVTGASTKILKTNIHCLSALNYA